MDHPALTAAPLIGEAMSMIPEGAVLKTTFAGFLRSYSRNPVDPFKTPIICDDKPFDWTFWFSTS
jgi:hypothetical protein